jgi:hypothetical protein
MTQTEDIGSPASKPAALLYLLLPLGLWLELPDTWANRRGIMILRRCLRRADGRPLVPDEHIAQALGYAERRNVHNYWAECEACGRELLAYLSRRKTVDAEVVACCEQIWQAHPLWPPAPVQAEIVRRLPEQGARLSVPNLRTAGQHVGFVGVQQALRRQVAEGQAHSKEEALIAALFALAEAQGEPAPPAVEPLPAVLERVPACAGPAPEAPRVAEQAARLADQLLTGETAPAALATLWHGPRGELLLSVVLYYHGLRLGGLGQLGGGHKPTVMRWLAPLAPVNWQAVGQQGRRYFSGLVAVDEQWIKIAGGWWYLCAAVDPVSGMPLPVALFPANSGAYCRLFLLQLKQLGDVPTVLITDGWEAYVTASALVFPHAQHLLGRFHALRAAWRCLKAALPDWSARCPWADELRHLCHTADKRTVCRRLEKLRRQATDTPVVGVIARLGGKLPQLLPAVGSTCRPVTSNAVEHFFAAFERFSRLQGPCQSTASAE